MTKLLPLEEALICELRTRLQLPLDDIAEVMRRCVNAYDLPQCHSPLSRSGMG